MTPFNFQTTKQKPRFEVWKRYLRIINRKPSQLSAGDHTLRTSDDYITATLKAYQK